MATTSDKRWTEAFDYGLTKIVDVSGMDIAFGARGVPDGRRMVIGRVRGARTTALQDLVVHSGTGLGGKALVLRRPVTVTDYVLARGISHQYDEPVSLEGIHSIAAVPLLVAGRVIGVFYAALRQRLGIGERVQRVVMNIAHETEQRLTSVLPTTEPPAPLDVDARLSSIRAELDSIIDRVGDPRIRAELASIRKRLGEPAADPGLPALSGRELETLRHAASGLANAQIAERMGLAAGTVKAYLGSVLRKLGCHNRMAAVNMARALGYPL